MMMRKTALLLASALITGFTMPALAQEADDDSDTGSMARVAEQAFGMGDADEDSDMIEVANLPAPDSAVFAALQGGFGSDENVVTIAQGPGPGHGPGPGPGGPPERGHWGAMAPHGPFGALHGDLALSDDQYEKMYAIRNDVSDSIAPKKLALHQAMRNMMDALGASNQDSARIKSLQTQIVSTKADISAAEMDKLVRMSQVLTPEQRKALHLAMIKGCIMHHGNKHHH